MLMAIDDGRDNGKQDRGKVWTKPELVRLPPDSPKADRARRKLGLID